MTTIVATSDFIICDRSVGFDCNPEKRKLLEKKYYLDNKGRGVLVHGGYRDFKRSKDFHQNIFNSVHALSHKTLSSDSEEMDKLLQSVTELFEKFVSDVMQVSDTLYLLTARHLFIREGKSTTVTVNYPGGVNSYGTGGALGEAMFLLGLAPEEIVTEVSKLDPMTSPEFDIFYSKDFAL